MKRAIRVFVFIIIAVIAVFPINTFVYADSPLDSVYLGGELIGLSTLTEGLYVSEICEVTTKSGVVTPLKGMGVSSGDILIRVNGGIVKTRADVTSLLKKGVNRLEFITKNGISEVYVTPVVDVLTNDLRLGIYLEGGIDGIGTLTFTTEKGVFSCLGHQASSGEKPSLINKGVLYKAEFLGIEKSRIGTPGKVNGVITRDRIGTLSVNSVYGVYGKRSGEYKGKLIPIGSRFSVTVGSATLLCNIDGSVKEYSIEILSAYMQPTIKEKGLTIRVTDKRILDNLGGIVQGMSGSPIIQGGKLVGAVTHVIIDEPDKGYGIYADFLKECCKQVG